MSEQGAHELALLMIGFISGFVTGIKIMEWFNKDN